jgi:large subunit ribosomal protein L9
MKLLLVKEVQNLGEPGDVVDVKNGYGRNYLLPYGFGVLPTKSNLKRIEELRRIAEREREIKRENYRQLASEIAGTELTIHARANEQGVLFGSVGPRDIVNALSAEGKEVPEDSIAMHEHFHQIGNYEVTCQLDEETAATIKVWVVREGKLPGEEEETEAEETPAAAEEEETSEEETAEET